MRFLWWSGSTLGIGLLPIWISLLAVGLMIELYPEYEKLDHPDWSVNRILANCVLCFFATTLVMQSLYTLSARRLLRGYHSFFGFLLSFGLILPIVVKFTLIIVKGQPIPKFSYEIDIMFATLAFLYAAYVQIFTKWNIEDQIP